MSTKSKYVNPFSSSMFESIKSSLEKPAGNSSFRDILKLEIGNTYLVRLVPNIKSPENSIYHYYNHGWNSLATGQFVSTLCPTTYGERCPIDEERFRVWNKGSEEEKEHAKLIKRNENWLVNVYVITDPTTPENEGTVKILRYGKQLHKIIKDAIDGDDSDEFGAKIFDLSPAGCNLRIKVESNSEGTGKGAKKFATYTASKFLSPSAIPGLEDPGKVYDNIFDLDKFYDHKSYDEIKDMLNTHYFCKVEKDTDAHDFVSPSKTKTSKPIDVDEDDGLDLAPSDLGLDKGLSDDDKMEELLKDL